MIGIIGGGRMGRGLAHALAEAGERVELWSRREAAGERAGPADLVGAAATILLAVPDGVIGAVAAGIAPHVSPDQVILHLSGVHDRGVLAPLSARGAACGSLHPLQTVPDPAKAAERWRGAYAAVEGDDRAVAEAERLAGLLALTPVRVPPGAKVLYHAGAVVASNYVVTLAGLAARWAAAAGLPSEVAGQVYRPLLAGAAANLAETTPSAALTGPIRRGDLDTVGAHLAALGGDDRRLYAVMGLETLRLAREGGLAPELAEPIHRLLREALAQ